MDRYESLRVFSAVADAQGFAAAARRLGLSPPAVTRAVAALEERLGVRLLHRTTRIVRLTEAGSEFLADARRILAELEEAEASVAGAYREPQGPLVVTAPVLFGRLHVAPVVLAFLSRYPLVQVRLLLIDRVADLIEEGMDVAVRIAHLPDSSHSAVRVGTVRRMVCGSPSYLAQHGTPKHPADLKRHHVISFSSDPTPLPWHFGDSPRGITVTPPAALMVNSAEVAVAAAAAGHGLTRVLSYQAAEELRSGRLRVILTKFEPPPIPIHVVHVEGRRANARVRAFVDFAAQCLKSRKPLL